MAVTLRERIVTAEAPDIAFRVAGGIIASAGDSNFSVQSNQSRPRNEASSKRPVERCMASGTNISRSATGRLADWFGNIQLLDEPGWQKPGYGLDALREVLLAAAVIHFDEGLVREM